MCTWAHVDDYEPSWPCLCVFAAHIVFVCVCISVCVCVASSSYQWYSWGPPNMQCRLCASCWTYWKKYGGLKMPTRLDGERPGPNRNNMVHTKTHIHMLHWTFSLIILQTTNNLSLLQQALLYPQRNFFVVQKKRFFLLCFCKFPFMWFPLHKHAHGLTETP